MLQDPTVGQRRPRVPFFVENSYAQPRLWGGGPWGVPKSIYAWDTPQEFWGRDSFLSIIYLSIYLSTYLSIYPLFIYLSIHLVQQHFKKMTILFPLNCLTPVLLIMCLDRVTINTTNKADYKYSYNVHNF